MFSFAAFEAAVIYVGYSHHSSMIESENDFEIDFRRSFSSLGV